MNMKQKLTYMFIGCLFTLAGTIISNLTNTPNKIVCKEIVIVNDDGKGLVTIGSAYGEGFMSINNAEDKKVVHIGALGDGLRRISNDERKKLVENDSNPFTAATLFIKDDRKPLVVIGPSHGGKSGYMDINNDDEKTLVGIGHVKGRPNDGLINIYNHTGKWRSYKGD